MTGAVVITPDGRTVYVVGGDLGGTSGKGFIVPVSTATNTAGPAIHTGLQPAAIAIESGHRR